MMKLRLLTSLFFVTIFSFSIFSVVAPKNSEAVTARDWKPGRIIDDAVFFNKDAMSPAQIQQFLNSKVPVCNTNYSWSGWYYGYWNAPPWTCIKDYQENGKSAAQIIWEAGQRHGINPQVLIITLQKETAIITDTWAAPWQYKRATGYLCPDSKLGTDVDANQNGCYDSHENFTAQINGAAFQLKRYTQFPDSYNFKAGVTRNILWSPNSSCGSSPVYIETQGTAALYNYTPYQPNAAALNNMYGTGDNCSAYGNRNFWRMFNDWFGSTESAHLYLWAKESFDLFLDKERKMKISSEYNISPDTKFYATLKVRNAGGLIWYKNRTNLGTEKPQDRSSIFHSDNWINHARPSNMVESIVYPREIATFYFELVSPKTAGSYNETFNLVVEGISWFNANEPINIPINVVQTISNFTKNQTALLPGQELIQGNYLLSADGHMSLDLQKDGNLVLYQPLRKPVWHTFTSGMNSKKLVMQNDGNLVLYNQNMKPLWNSETSGNPGSYLVMQNDGNLVLYTKDSKPLWATYSIHYPSLNQYISTKMVEGLIYPGQRLDNSLKTHQLVFQNDGNLVLYTKDSKPLWDTGTHGKQSKYLYIQSDGNLVLYDSQMKPLWNSSTSKTGPGNILVMQNDGNLVLYNKFYKPVWSTGTVSK